MLLPGEAKSAVRQVVAVACGIRLGQIGYLKDKQRPDEVT